MMISTFVIAALLGAPAATAPPEPPGLDADATLEVAAALADERCDVRKNPTRLPACDTVCPAPGGLDHCRFSDPTLAAVARLVAPKDAEDARRALIKAFPAPASAPKSPKKFAAGVFPAALPGAAELSTAFTHVAVKLLQGLALVIADRAQRESVAFVLDELTRTLCNPKSELKGWFRSTCGLATDTDGNLDLQAYGSGAPSLQLLRSALEADVRAFPSVTASAVFTRLYEADQRQFVIDDGHALDAGGIGTTSSLDEAVERATADLISGAYVFDALEPLMLEIDTTNQHPELGKYPAPRLQWLACGLALPSHASRTQLTKGVADEGRAYILASLLLTPPCESMLAKPTRLERLVALDDKVAPLAASFLALKKQIDDEQGRYRTAMALPPPATADGGVDVAARNVAVVGASVRVSRAALQMSAAWLHTGATICDLVKPPYKKVCDTQRLDLKKADQFIGVVDRQLAVAQNVIEGDWNRVALTAVQLGIDFCEGDATCKKKVPKLGGAVNSALTLLQAKSGEDAAKIIDGLASPIGEWRGKLKSGRFTASLMAYAGISGGAEVRWGQYGVVYEKGGIYGQAPTVSLPLGIELAHGWSSDGKTGDRSTGFFISLIDPLAFLQYDVTQGGKLPGAKLLSVLAPGLHLRFGINSPFGIGPYIVFRPGFRSYESGVNVAGANVLQVGLELTVDVTLFTLARKDAP